MYLLIYIAPYNSINVLYDPKRPAPDRVVKVSIVRLPPPAFIDNYENVWPQVFNEIKLSLDLKAPAKVFVNIHPQSLWFNSIDMDRSCKKISPKDSFCDMNIPFMYFGEEQFYSPLGAYDFEVSPQDVSKWFEFGESLSSIEDFWGNRSFYGAKPARGAWEVAFNEAILREKVFRAMELFSQSLLKDVEELYLSGEVLYGYSNLAELLLMVLNSANVPGAWTLFLDKDSILGPVSALLGVDKDNVLSFLKEHQFLCMSHIFVVPEVPRAQVTSSDNITQALTLKKEGLFLVPPAADDVEVSVKVGKEAFEKSLSPSSLGIVFDTRKRPLGIPDSRVERLKLRDLLRKQISNWEV